MSQSYHFRARGVCWNISPEPTIGNNTTINGSGVGTFTSILRGLIPDTKYYIRAYATNNIGTSYGNEDTFLTKDGIPVLETRDVKPIYAISAYSGGLIISDGSLPITSKGVCWNTSPNPIAVKDFMTVDTGGENIFRSILNDLIPDTKYYIRAYATNKYKTSYGNEISFTTRDGKINITTNPLCCATIASIQAGGTVNDDGGSVIMSRGICWSAAPDPGIDDSTILWGKGMGVFSCTIPDLMLNKRYYCRAFATNAFDTSYGNELSFVLPFFQDIRDNRIYKWVEIGDQIWMAENLAFLSAVSPPSIESWDSPVCYVYGYNDISVGDAINEDNYKVYGVLYNWPAAMNGGVSSDLNPSGVQGICPDGWHLPSDAEWNELIDFLGGTAAAGGKLKETGFAHWSSPNAAASNSSGFTALPGGFRSGDGTFSEIGLSGWWWSATNFDGGNAWRQSIGSSGGDIRSWHNNLRDGYNIRCVKD
jgi:uncharacterized protein (TIGR02145 family)